MTQLTIECTSCSGTETFDSFREIEASNWDYETPYAPRNRQHDGKWLRGNCPEYPKCNSWTVNRSCGNGSSSIVSRSERLTVKRERGVVR